MNARRILSSLCSDISIWYRTVSPRDLCPRCECSFPLSDLERTIAFFNRLAVPVILVLVFTDLVRALKAVIPEAATSTSYAVSRRDTPDSSTSSSGNGDSIRVAERDESPGRGSVDLGAIPVETSRVDSSRNQCS